MRNIVLSIAYEGTHFLGWQKTKAGRSVEETLQTTLEQILQHEVVLQAASRTDAGVHAEGQIVNFSTPSSRYTPLELHKALLQMLPKDLIVIDVQEKESSFHPTLSAKGKIYRYRLSTGLYQLPSHRLYAWHYPYPIDIKRMEEAALQLLGQRDFSAFCNDKSKTLKNPICHLQSIYIEPGQEGITLYLEGDRFLYKMVRNLVGTLAYIGSSKLPLSALEAILLGKDRTQAGVTAPAHGLTLYKVIY